MKWTQLRIQLEKTLPEGDRVKPLKKPNVRLNSLRRIDQILNDHFPLLVDDITRIKEFDKEEFKEIYAQKKPSGKINGAESSIINQIYKSI